MKKIFCLETEWNQSIHDLKKNSSVQSLLKFFETSSGIDREDKTVPYIFRQVATKSDFEYYILHLLHDSYANYDMIYLCFHGSKGEIYFANGESIGIHDLGKDDRYKDIFAGKIVHFGSCWTMDEPESFIKRFKRHTGAALVTGYQTSVDFTQSFIFELWLLETLRLYPHYRAKKLLKISQEQMPFFCETLNFVAY